MSPLRRIIQITRALRRFFSDPPSEAAIAPAAPPARSHEPGRLGQLYIANCQYGLDECFWSKGVRRVFTPLPSGVMLVKVECITCGKCDP